MSQHPVSAFRHSLSVAAILLLTAASSSAQLLQSWQFNEASVVGLPASANAVSGGATFITDVAGIATNGSGSLVIAYTSDFSGRSSANIGSNTTGIYQVDVNVAGWNFANAGTTNPSFLPLLEIGLSDTTEGGRAAHLYFEVTPTATFLAGVAGGTGGTESPPAQDLFLGLVRTTPITFRLVANLDNRTYTVSTSDAPTVFASGTIAPLRNANFLHIRALDNFVTTGANGTQGNFTIDSITLTRLPPAPVLTPYQTWLQTNFLTTDATGNAADNADPDGDGVVNLIEYIADTNPNVSSANPIVAATFTDVNGTFLTLTYPRRAGDASLTYTVQSVSDLATPFTTALGATVTTGNSSTYTDNVAFGTANPRRFLRLSVTR